MPPKILEFQNPVFHDGFNLTVRRGIKWSYEDQAIVNFGPKHYAVVNLMTVVKRFDEINDYDLVYEHDPICRTVDGLAKVMKEVYHEFERTDMVTLAVFYLRLRPPQKGDQVFHADMSPVLMGSVTDVIQLNDGYYEITYSFDIPDGEVTHRSIVHEAEWLTNIPNGTQGGTRGWMPGDSQKL